MSTRTIIEINHDYLKPETLADLIELFNRLHSSSVTGLLNAAEGAPVQWGRCGIRILAQRHHSETLNLEVR